MTAPNVLYFPLGPTEPRHDTEDPAWLEANRYLRDHPEHANVSSAVLLAFIAGAKNERRRLEAERA